MYISDTDLVLYEGKLADKFGVSRTPIRQVIQALAAESLVEVRSGIGTIAPSMRPERRTQDLKAYSAILNACATCAQPSDFKMMQVELTALRMHLEADSGSPPIDVFFDVATRVIAALSALVDDEILKDTLIACFWRFVRRRITDHKGNVALVVEDMIQTIKDIEHGAENGGAEQTLRIACKTVDNMLKGPDEL